MKLTTRNKQFKFLKKHLEKKRDQLREEFEEKQSEAAKWVSTRGLKVADLAQKGAKTVSAGIAAGTLLLSVGSATDRGIEPASETRKLSEGDYLASVKSNKDLQPLIKEGLAGRLPTSVRPLNESEEKGITNLLTEILNYKVTAELDGNRLNRNYGYIGGEQHLARYPGETLQAHFNTIEEAKLFGASGIAGRPGAFGYFAYGSNSLTNKEVKMEKYYVAVQTFASPGWGTKSGLVDWYKFRKVLVINPRTGQGVVATIADSGPAAWTGKSFGGSPEVMHYLGLGEGARKGDVLLFFKDDKNDKISYGAI